jgi:hypothetical protein
VSILNRSLALEETRETEEILVDLAPVRHLSISNASSDPQPKVVTVSGSIIVSF